MPRLALGQPGNHLELEVLIVLDGVFVADMVGEDGECKLGRAASAVAVIKAAGMVNQVAAKGEGSAHALMGAVDVNIALGPS